ncbi:MAG: primosomal protein N' [Candidatus Cloacimonetes bacterium]|nr:primosomal protein N' [Candidatus Cloacimonadota bacterium]MCF7814440.1 primosomal protein N' [Candidatus Cloacimonadota bacterium]MCF7868790.1 primosomal protein N' [Candidatus Cloacimonadota bacterium]
MKYYDIALPVSLDKLFSYRSNQPIRRGCRVLVSFGNSYHTGVVWQETQKIDTKLDYKFILEVVDEKPKISENLLKLAQWISRYYQCSLGMALNAMLPSAFNVQIQQQVKLLSKKIIPESDGNPELIINELSELEWLDIADLKKKLSIPSTSFNEWLEKLEDMRIVEIKRVFDAKIKKKIANFVIQNKVQEIPDLTDKQAAAWQLISKYKKPFLLREIVEDVTRSILKALEKKGLVSIEPRELQDEEYQFKAARVKKEITLTGEQKTAVIEINQAISSNQFLPFLLFGITGSGKTEVYIEAIKQCLQEDKTALMLVPEISLTPQMVERFFNAFGQDIAILHSHLNERQRWQQWKKIKSGKSRIVIGARSAIFAPLDNIGIIIVDEEHETTYKQDKTPKYNGRDIAIVRARLSKCVVILGSATPSLESWQNVELNRFLLLKLTQRPLEYELPKVQIIDMCEHKDPKILISQELRDKIEEKIAAKEQVILLQNRRGHSSFVQCISCGKLFACSNCDISLNFHSHHQELICHFCGQKTNMPRKCPDCGNYLFQFGAPGTQQIEKQLQVLFPQARILRMDSDSARSRDSYDSMYDRMGSGNVDILLGTQMIAKGLDFANVTLVGVVLADISLNVPDFRAAEKTFQLLTQVAGRSGRGKKLGEVIIQTYNPEHFAIQLAMQQDFEKFADKELKLRQILKYPPAQRMARILFTNPREQYLREQLATIHPLLNKIKSYYDSSDLSILGPVQAPMVRLQNSYRYHIIIKAASVQIISQVVNRLKENIRLSSSIKMSIDIDPYGLM